MPRYKLPLGATAISLLLASCGGEAEPKPVETAPAIENILDDAAPGKERLASTIAPFFDDPALEETRAIVVMHGGRVVAERYAPGFGPDSRLISWSMAKSVTATLIGMMVADGLLVLDDTAPVPEWSSPGDPRAKIT